MKVIFEKSGTYKNEYVNIVITEKDVKDKKVFNVFEGNAMSYIKKGLAVLSEEIKKDETFETDIDKMTVDELKEYAKGKEIDLGEATKKADILEAIKTETDPDTGDGTND